MAVRALAIPEGGFREIAVLRLSSLGDVVLTLPVVAAIRAAFPAAKLHAWVREEYAGVLRHDPRIDHVRVLERDSRKLEDLVSMSAELESCDLLVDLHGNVATRVLTFRQKAPVLRAATDRGLRERWVRARWTNPAPARSAVARYGVALAPLGLSPAGTPRVYAGEAAETWAAGWLAEWAPARAPLALAPGARHATKRWPLERWLELEDALEGRAQPRVYFASAAERRELAALESRTRGRASVRWCVEPLERAAALLSRTPVALTHDSGLMHLAAARGARVVAIFGSTSPVLGFAPMGEGHEVLCRNEPCQPCTLHGREKCPKGHFRCMTGWTVDDVLAAVHRAHGAGPRISLA